MDGFIYNDIFQTKGIEYLIIIAFLLLIIPFWVIINKREQISRNIQRGLDILRLDILKIPKGLFYSPNHTWAHIDKSGIAEVGLDDFLLHLTGEVKFANLKEPGDHINKGELLAKIAQNDKVLRVFSPISGKVIKTNQALNAGPDLIDEDPYNQGWIYKLEPTDWKTETSAYHFGEEAKLWFKRDLERFKDFIAVSMGKVSSETSMIILQEGGELRDHSLEELPVEVWQNFQKEFLDN